MKKFRIIAVLAIAFCFLLGTTSVYGDEDEYNHRLTVSGGNGSIEGFDGNAGTSDITIVPGPNAVLIVGGESHKITPPEYEDSPDKYFVKGLKLAGHDNNDTEGKERGPLVGTYGVNKTGSLIYGGDAEMVVAYGLRSNMVKYTVEYLDENGADMPGTTTETHYGAIGDKPIVSYKYFDGYLPNAYHATKELQKDESLNVFTFKYTPVQAAEGQTIINYTDNGNAAAGGNAAGNAAGNAGAGNAAGNAAANAGTTIGDNPAPLAINDQDTPLANADQDEKGGSALPYIIGGVIVAAIIAAIAAVLARRRGEEGAE